MSMRCSSPTRAGLFFFPHPKIHPSLRKGTNDAHSEGESIAGDGGEGHSPLIESSCPVFAAIHLAHPFIRSVDTVDSRIPMKARLSWLGWAVGEGCRGGSRAGMNPQVHHCL